MLVQQVVDVERRRELVIELVTRHGIEQPIGLGAMDLASAGGRVGDGAEGAALPARATAEAPAISHTGEPVAGVHAELVFRLQRGDLGGLLARDLVRVAALDLPARRQLTGHLQLVALGAHPHQAFIGDPATRRPAAGRLRVVVLFQLEHRRTGIEATIVELRFQAGFVAAPFQRIQHPALLVLVALRLEDGAVAGEHRDVAIEVVHQAGIRHDHAALVGIRRLVVGDAAAEDQLERIGQVETSHHVGTAFAGDLVVTVAPLPIRLRHIAGPGVVVGNAADIARLRRVAVVDPALARHAAADDQLVLAAEPLELSADVQIGRIAGGLADVLAQPHAHTLTGNRIGIATGRRAQ